MLFSISIVNPIWRWSPLHGKYRNQLVRTLLRLGKSAANKLRASMDLLVIIFRQIPYYVQLRLYDAIPSYCLR